MTEDEVKANDDGDIDVPDSARAGETIRVGLGGDHAGEAARTFLYSEPTQIGQSMADASGGISVTIPLATAPGEHTLAVYGADGELIGWAAITILPAAAGDELSTTGPGSLAVPLAAAVLLMLAGAGMAVGARRQQESAR